VPRPTCGLSAFLLLIFLTIGLPAAAENSSAHDPTHPIQPVEKRGLQNAYRLGNKIYSGSRPKGEEGIRDLKDLGVTAILSVEDVTPDFEAAHRLGLKYVHVPLDKNGVKEDQKAEVLKVVREATGPVYFHCTSGVNRGPTAAALAAVAFEGWTVEEALSWMELAGTSHQNEGLYDAVREFGAEANPAKLVGIGYQTWFPPQKWDKAWDEPELERYDSSDKAVIRRHAEWLSEAGVDFIWNDWSNNITSGPGREDLIAIESATHKVFEIYSDLEKRPKISIFLGIDNNPDYITNGALKRKADQVYETYIADPRFRPLIQDYLGKPLLVIYVWCPSPFQEGLPQWDDPRFTVRWMTGFMDDQPNLAEKDGRSKYGFWSWWDRSPQTFSVLNGQPEAMVVSAAFPGHKGWEDSEHPGRGRRKGETFREQWRRACEIGPKIVVVNSWNEWIPNEELTPEQSNDIEPSKSLGHFYLDLMREEIARFKSGH
jgi:protein tyrosine phosphatase (PTP) superfamily phosphohydrolase (DUF442 family)